jgi:hypothetical protein
VEINRPFARISRDLAFSTHHADRLYPTLLPAVWLGIAYLARAIIYATVSRRKHELDLDVSAITGPVYWSHITAYGMFISVAVVVAKAPIWMVVGLSVALFLVMFAGFYGFLGDVGVLFRELYKGLWLSLRSLIRLVGERLNAIAATARALVEHGQYIYETFIQAPMENASAWIKERSESFNERTERRLETQNRRLKERSTSREDRRARRSEQTKVRRARTAHSPAEEPTKVADYPGNPGEG